MLGRLYLSFVKCIYFLQGFTNPTVFLSSLKDFLFVGSTNPSFFVFIGIFFSSLKEVQQSSIFVAKKQSSTFVFFRNFSFFYIALLVPDNSRFILSCLCNISNLFKRGPRVFEEDYEVFEGCQCLIWKTWAMGFQPTVFGH